MELARAVVAVDLIVDTIELRTIDYVNDQVNDHDLPGRVGAADSLARQGETDSRLESMNLLALL